MYIYIYIYIRTGNYAPAIASTSFPPGSRRDPLGIPAGSTVCTSKLTVPNLKQLVLTSVDAILMICYDSTFHTF